MSDGIIRIHGKEYMTVAQRVKEAGDDFIGVDTEVLNHMPVVVKATVTTSKGEFSGISSANPDKAIEKTNPYEVAETSAIGRALGFAGYGVIDSVASADEMHKAGVTQSPVDRDSAYTGKKYCSTHPTGFLGKDQHGNYYKKCMMGNKLNESCEIKEADEV